ncbi:MAG: hypothetical protein AB8G15_08770 [Saprospiraceae bacterium]
MPISQSNQVFNLVKSLTKAEKRNFRLYAKRIQDNGALLFLQLFDVMDKQKVLKETEILTQLGQIGKGQFSNLKRHLYAQIIASLRMLHKEKRANFKVREYLDYAYILYGKGLYLQALKLLRKASILANKHHLIYMQLTIVEFEKTIESRHITRSGNNKAEMLIEESALIQRDANHLVRLSNLRIKMHGKYLQYGHVRSSKEAAEIRAYYHEQIDEINLEELGLMERIYYVQSRVWYNYILLDFHACIKYAIAWTDLLHRNPNMIERDVDLYMRGYHYVLTAANHIKDKETHSKYLMKFEAFREGAYGKFNTNSQILSFLYVHTGRLDNIILNGNFNLSESIIPKSLNRIRRYKFMLDDHRIMVFYFKFAWIYLGAGNISKALRYLNKIINNELKKLREDLQNYARILQLICHYELGSFDIFQYLLNNNSNYFDRKSELNIFLQETMNMFNELKSKGISDHKIVFEKYLTSFLKIKEDPYERRAFVYLDIIAWLESKVKGISLQAVIQGKPGWTNSNR